jgi:2-methylcitrate dehydratase PrpD
VVYQLCRFIHETRPQDLPDSVRHQATLCLIDIVGTAFAAHASDLSQIIHDFAATVYAGKGASLWFDGRPFDSRCALANQRRSTLDIHDGHS